MKKNKALYLIADKYLWALSSFIYLFVLARTLGGKYFSIYSFFMSFSLFFGFVSFTYITSILTKEMIENKNHQEELFISRAFFSFSMLIVVLSIVYFFSAWFFTPYFIGYTGVVYILLFGAFFQSLNTFEFYYQSDLNFEKVLIYKCYIIVASLFLKIIVIYNFPSIYVAALLYSIELFIINIYSSVFYFKSNGLVRIYSIFHSKKIYKMLFSFFVIIKCNWPLLISFLAITLYAKIDQYMIGILYEDKSGVGILAILNRLIDGLVIGISIIGILFFPKLVKAYNTSEYHGELKKYIISSIAVSFILSLLFLLFSRFFIIFVFKYETSYITILIYSATVFFNCFSIAVGRVFIVEGLLTVALYRNVSALFVNIILNYLLIPDFGVLGAGVASLISWFLSGFIFLIFSRKTSHILGVIFK